MKFRTLFMAHTPDADMEKHHAKIETDMYVLHVNLVKDQKEALEVAKDMAENEGIHSIMLCPGFTHEDVAELYGSLDGVAVTVARGDGPSSGITQKVMNEVGWFD